MTREQLISLLVDKTMWINSSNQNQYYLDLGYDKILNKTTNKQGFLVDIVDLPKGSHRKVLLRCIAKDCEEVREVELRKFYKQSYTGYCNNHIGLARLHDITNERFNRLVAIKVTDQRTASGGVVWECLCDCGNTKLASINDLRFGLVESCGCLNKEIVSELLLDFHRRKGHRIRSEHSTEENKEFDEQQGFYKSYPWLKIRRIILNKTPNCYICGDTATLVHHLNSKFTHPELSLEQTNLVALCAKCHAVYHSSIMYGYATEEDFKRQTFPSN